MQKFISYWVDKLQLSDMRLTRTPGLAQTGFDLYISQRRNVAIESFNLISPYFRGTVAIKFWLLGAIPHLLREIVGR